MPGHPAISLRAHATRRGLRALEDPCHQRKEALAAFTLVELMIVVSVIGILSAIALPQFLSARARVDAGAAVGEIIGLAKQCATGNATGFAETLKDGAGTPVTCNSTTVVMESRAFDYNAEGVRCLSEISSPGDTKATITIDANGRMTCAFS